MYITLTYTGGVYRQNEIEELVEDLGGFVVQKNITQTGVIMLIAVPEKDTNKVREKAQELHGEIENAPLGGTEIAIVAPSLSPQHMPHPLCDIAEYLRRQGAKTNFIGLARGVGRRIAQISESEKRLLEEHDAAVLALGCFSKCITEKAKLISDITIPIIVTGAPQIEEKMPYVGEYVSGVERICRRFQKEEEIKVLERIANAVTRCIDKRREDIDNDPPAIQPFFVKKMIEQQVPAIKQVVSPAPIVVKLDGLRVKLPFNKYQEKILNVNLAEKVKIRDVAKVKASEIKGHTIVKILPESVVAITI